MDATSAVTGSSGADSRCGLRRNVVPGAAERFGVSAASAIRWRQLALRHGAPAAKPQGSDRRTARIEDHAAFILEAIQQQPDPTLAELRIMLGKPGVSVSIATLWRFFTGHGITRKKRPATRRSRIVPTS